MTPELRAEARRVYLELLDLPVDQRAAHLERVCAGRPDLRAEVESLLRSDDEAGSFLADPSAKSVVDADATPVDDRARRASETAAERGAVGTRIGPYVLGQHLGVGGFGDV